jgi:uncharacterized SAM-binding protein YcdF (DUF218 family)
MDAPGTGLEREQYGRANSRTPGAATPSNLDTSGTGAPATGRRRSWFPRIALGLILLALVAAGSWFAWVFGQIRYYATHDEARPADAIAVFGAAEYDGHPSPVLRARLDHALALYERGLAPMIVTLGGQGDALHSEGSVGRDYLVAHGVPESQIIAETRSNNTEASASQLAVIAQENQLARVIAVSDATHLFRIRALCQHYGLQVFTSPRDSGKPIRRRERVRRIAHELLSYSLWRLGV